MGDEAYEEVLSDWTHDGTHDEGHGPEGTAAQRERRATVPGQGGGHRVPGQRGQIATNAGSGGPRGASGRAHRVLERTASRWNTQTRGVAPIRTASGTARTPRRVRHNHASPRASTQAVTAVAARWAASIGRVGMAIVTEPVGTEGSQGLVATW